MDGINVYLGLGVFLVVVGLFGFTKGFGFEVSTLTKFGRVAAVLLGVGAIVAAYTLPLPGTGDGGRADADSAATVRANETASYQRQVLAACSAVRAEGDLRTVQPGQDGLFDRDQLVAAMSRADTAEKATLANLWRETVPEGLGASAATARTAAGRLYGAVDSLIADLRRSPRRLGSAQVETVADQVGSPTLTSDLQSALDGLAGQTCGFQQVSG